MRAVFVSQHDYANSGAWIAKALSTQGIETACFAGRHSPFDYPERPRLIRENERAFRDALGEADWIVVVQSDFPRHMGGNRGEYSPRRADWLRELRGKRFCVVHGGSYYRQRPERYVAIWRDLAEATICYSADLMGHFDNEHLIVPPMDMTYFPPVERGGPIVVGHSPARPEQKGTEGITDVLKRIGCEARIDKGRIDWRSQLERLRQCDIVIDQIYPEENGKPVGEWVALATEAAATGCVTIANSHRPGRYVETYGRMPEIRICNTFAHLEAELRYLLALPVSELRALQRKTRQWVVDHHSLEPTGRLLVERIFGKPARAGFFGRGSSTEGSRAQNSSA